MARRKSTTPHEKRRNASVIAYSPAFQAAVGKIRSELEIPAEGFKTPQKREVWYRDHHAKHSGESPGQASLYRQADFSDLIDKMAALVSEPTAHSADVPLDIRAWDLVRRFQLPDDLVGHVKDLILGSKGLSTAPPLMPVVLPIDDVSGDKKFAVLIAGIDGSSTRKEWLQAWRNVQDILRIKKVRKVAARRPDENKKFLRDLTFWKWSNEGKAVSEIADKWLKEHPNPNGLGDDTVRKGIARIQVIMRGRTED